MHRPSPPHRTGADIAKLQGTSLHAELSSTVGAIVPMACRANQIFSQRDIATAWTRNATAFESVGAQNHSTEEQRQNAFNCKQFVTPASRAIAALPFAGGMSIFDMETQHWTSLMTKGSPGYEAFSADGRFIYFLLIGLQEQGVFRVRVKGGKPERVIRPEGLAYGGVFLGMGWR